MQKATCIKRLPRLTLVASQLQKALKIKIKFDSLTVVSATDDNSDGKITGVTDKMEYRKSGESGFTAVTDGKTEITGLAKGSYEIRMKENTNYLASETITIEVGAKITPPSVSEPEIPNTGAEKALIICPVLFALLLTGCYIVIKKKKVIE